MYRAVQAAVFKIERGIRGSRIIRLFGIIKNLQLLAKGQAWATHENLKCIAARTARS